MVCSMVAYMARSSKVLRRNHARAARMLAGFGLDTAAAACKTTPDTMRSAVEALHPRGRCDQIAAGCVDGKSWELAAAAGFCSPAVVVSAAGRAGPHAAAGLAGVAAWPKRRMGFRAAPRALIAVSAHSSNQFIRSQAARAAGVGRAVLVRLASDPDRDVRRAVAANDTCPSDALRCLASDRYMRVRVDVARHRGCPPGTLDVLENDNTQEVRVAVGTNPGCSAELLAGNARHGDSSFREAAASNPACGSEMLESLAGDADPMVRAAAAANAACVPGTLAKILESSSDLIFEAAASNPNCPPGVLAALAASADFNDKMAAADHSNCPPGVLAELAERQTSQDDPDLDDETVDDFWDHICCQVALNPNCPISTLMALTYDVDPDTKHAALESLARRFD